MSRLLLIILLIIELLQHRTLAFQQVRTRTPILSSGQARIRQRYISNNSNNQNTIIIKSKRRQRQQNSFELYSQSNNSANGSNNPIRPNNPIRWIKKRVLKISAAIARFRARFQALPKKAKRIAIIQMFIFLFLFGSAAKNVYVQNGPPPPIEISYSSFLDLMDNQGSVESPSMTQVRIGNDKITFKLYKNENGDNILHDPPNLKEMPKSIQKRLEKQNQRPFLNAYTRKIPASTSEKLVDNLRKNDISFAAAAVPRTSTVVVFVRTAMVAFYFLILLRLYKTVSGGPGGSSNKSDVPGKLAQTSDLPMASFDDIQGIDSAKIEVMELVDSLRNPEKYAILGARAPTGLLLVGPPGTGKTMLARATAATAGVPLLYCSGSDFVEMFVGRGAARVRKLFERADKLAPCIIFIDELDALGKSRDMTIGGASFSRSNDEAEQTLNQLLACMDGLDSSRQICVLAATNRKEVLDSALIRPGRFDRIVNLELPNALGREKILRVHTSKLPGFTEGTGVDPDRPNALGKGRMVDLSAVAASTIGFSGAELEFLVNEAAIRAVRRVSAALQKGTPTNDIIPHVEAKDFEESLKSFYQTRKPKGSTGGSVNDILKNVWKA